jgi:hypothetical protein
MTFQQWQDYVGYAKREFRSLCGLVASVAGALSAHAGLGPPWQHWVSVLCVGAGAAFLYMTKPFQTREIWGSRRNGNCSAPEEKDR